jgi:hypothetical protein
MQRSMAEVEPRGGQMNTTGDMKRGRSLRYLVLPQVPIFLLENRMIGCVLMTAGLAREWHYLTIIS